MDNIDRMKVNHSWVNCGIDIFVQLIVNYSFFIQSRDWENSVEIDVLYNFSDTFKQVVAVPSFIKIVKSSENGEWLILEKSAKLQACNIFNKENGVTVMVDKSI